MPTYTAPYAPGPGRMTDAFRVADLIAQQGQSQAHAQAVRGYALADLIGTVGGTVGTVLQRRDETKQAAADQAREQYENEQIADLLASGQDVNAGEIIRRVGIERARLIVPLAEASAARRQALAEKEQKARDEQNARGMRQRSVEALQAGADPAAVNLELYGETGGQLPTGLVPDPKVAEAARVAANTRGMQQRASEALGMPGANSQAIQREFFGQTGTVLPEEVTGPKPEKLTLSAPQPYRLNGDTVMLRAGSDNKMYDPSGHEVDAAHLKPYVAPSTAQGPQPAWQWVKRDGKAVYTNRVLDGDEPRPTTTQRPTEEMGKAAGYYVQMKDAVGVMDELEDGITQTELYQIQTLPQEKLLGFLNRHTTSEAAKRYLRAFEQFTEARLRSVSGAAIADSEYERDRRTYAKQYGETPKLSEDRFRARGVQMDSLRRRAGTSLDDSDLAPPPEVPADVAAALQGEKPGIVTLSDGTRWRVRTDGSIGRVR